MKGVVKFLEISFQGRCRMAIMADKSFIRRENLVKLEIHSVSSPQTVLGSKTKGK